MRSNSSLRKVMSIRYVYLLNLISECFHCLIVGVVMKDVMTCYENGHLILNKKNIERLENYLSTQRIETLMAVGNKTAN